MKDVMLDIETLGTSSNAVVVSIGAVFFDPIAIDVGETFYAVCSDLDTQIKRMGRQMDADTVMWWLQQSEKARDAIAKPLNIHATETTKALFAFRKFLSKDVDVRVWGNGIDFDNVVLGNLYKAMGETPPWKFRNNMCYRTLKTLAEDHGRVVHLVQENKHNALSDAIFQANMVPKFYKALALSAQS
jgi:hypothetical protein